MRTALTSPGNDRYVVALAVLFGLEWAALAISPRYRQDCALENALTVAFVAALVVFRNQLPLSRVSYTAHCGHRECDTEEQQSQSHWSTNAMPAVYNVARQPRSSYCVSCNQNPWWYIPAATWPTRDQESWFRAAYWM